MISARGAQAMRTVLTEVAAQKARASCGGPLLTLPDFERAWNAACKVLRSQLLLGASIIFASKVLSFYQTRRVKVIDGDTKYSIRENHIGFSPNFVTTYSLDSTVPREDPKVAALRLPLELVAAEAQLPVQAVSDALREIFLYVGESLFQGKLIELTFPGVCNILIKRDHAVAKFDQALRDELFAIDTRKWPSHVREAASFRTSSPPKRSSVASSRCSVASEGAATESSRPASRAPSTGRRSTSANPPSGRESTVPPRPSFVASAPRGLAFDDIAARLEQRKKVLEAGPRVVDPKAKKGPLKGRSGVLPPQTTTADDQKPAVAHLDPAAMGVLNSNDEESVYSMLTPGRERDVADIALPPVESDVAEAIPDAAADVPQPNQFQAANSHQFERVVRSAASVRSQQTSSDIFHLVDTNAGGGMDAAERRRGRRLCGSTANQQGSGVRDLLIWDKPRLHDNLL